MSSFDVDRDGDHILLLRCDGPFGVPVSQWKLTPTEAERIAKILTEAAKSMRKRSASKIKGDES